MSESSSSNEQQPVPGAIFRLTNNKRWDGPDDVTVYSQNIHWKGILGASKSKEVDSNLVSEDELAEPSSGLTGSLSRKIFGRMLVCKSYDSKFFSITARIDKDKSKGSWAYEIDRHLQNESASPWQDSKEPSAKYPVPISWLCDCLVRNLFVSLEGNPIFPTGAIVVTGSTGTSKSTIARHLIHFFLNRQIESYLKAVNSYSLAANKKKAARPNRRPHLLTIENPIERFFFTYKSEPNKGKRVEPQETQKLGLDYTPRELNDEGDVSSLAAAFADALRQTPAVVYVGEVRKEEEWKEVMRFAQTGHLVVTTAHAGSLTETMDQLFQSNDVKTAADRGSFAGRISALIHLKKFPICSSEVVLPAVWFRTPRGIASLVTEGLSSLLPSRDESSSSRGRLWFADQLVERLAVQQLPANFRTELTRAALNSDLQGI